MNAKRRVVTAFAAAGFLVSAATARADTITPSWTGTTYSGLFTWHYQADFVGVGFQMQPGSFFTIFDFGTYVPGTCVAPSGWSCGVGSTIQPSLPSVNGPATDLTFTYQGPIVPGTALAQTFTGFSAQSTQRFANWSEEYVAQDALANGTLSPLVAIGPIFVPQEVPEPSTLLLLGAGLVAAALRRRPSA